MKRPPMQSVDYRIKTESWDRAASAGRYNRGSVVLLRYKRRDYVVPIGAGDSDSVDVFRQRGLLFVVSVNRGLGYCGLEVFDLDDTAPDLVDNRPRVVPDKIGETFLQTDYEVSELLGPRGLDLHPRTIAKYLADYALA